jgi:hypothetical protein
MKCWPALGWMPNNPAAAGLRTPTISTRLGRWEISE